MPFWPKRVSIFRLFVCDDVYRRFTWVDLSTRSWFPTALMLAVAVSARASAALPKEEATLSRELRTPPLPATHVPVGYCWQNSRCCRSSPRPQHSHIDDFVSHHQKCGNRYLARFLRSYLAPSADERFAASTLAEMRPTPTHRIAS